MVWPLGEVTLRKILKYDQIVLVEYLQRRSDHKRGASSLHELCYPVFVGGQDTIPSPLQAANFSFAERDLDCARTLQLFCIRMNGLKTHCTVSPFRKEL